MIVDPDFPDHWKTRLLVDQLDGDESAPVYLLRLWAHCQNRRSASFDNLPAAALKALCRFPGHANKLESSMVVSGFVRRDGHTLIVIGWEEYNASLIANWRNGSKGGRPKKPRANPNETHGFSTGNPPVSHGEPIREEKNEEENVSARDDAFGEQARQIVEAYPRKEKIASALMIVAGQLRQGESFEAMIAGTRACAAVIRSLPSGAMNRYVPGAETFFAAKRWQDDPESLRRQGPSKSGGGQMGDADALEQLGGRSAGYRG